MSDTVDYSKSLKEALIQINSTRDKVTSDKLESDCLTLCSRVERIASKLESYIKYCTHEQSIDKHLAYYTGLSEGLHSAIDEINAVRIAAVDVIPELELVLMELEKVFSYGTMARVIVTVDPITGTMKRDDKLSIKSMRDDAICAYEKAGKYIVDLSNRLLVEVRHIIAQSQQKQPTTAGNEVERVQEVLPSDLIEAGVAIKDYHISKSTINRQIKPGGKLKDYRKPGYEQNDPVLLSRSEVAGKYPKRS